MNIPQTLVALSFISTPLLAQSTARVSVDSLGFQGNDESYCDMHDAVSADGRFVVFRSIASNLVPQDLNGNFDVFLRDRDLSTTQRVSVSSIGGEGLGASALCSISGDGRCIAFCSFAPNLVAGDTNNQQDVFVRDVALGTTERVSLSTTGTQGNGTVYRASLSFDGRFVVFESASTTLVPSDTNSAFDVFLRDRQSGTTEVVSVNGATVPNAASAYPAMSPDARFIVFLSWASDLVPNDTNGFGDVFLRDRLLGTTERVSVSSTGAEANAALVTYSPSVSADGRFVVFTSAASNLVPNDTNGQVDVFLRDRLLGTTSRVSVGTNGTQGDGPSQFASISADGRRVVFDSIASTLISGDANGAWDVFMRDLQLGTTERINVNTQGTESAGARLPWISHDARFIVFESGAHDLVLGDTGPIMDVFVHDLSPRITTYCEGDGISNSCPCGNNGAPSNGCGNSLFASGAALSAAGHAGASAATDTLRFTATRVPGPTLFFQGSGTSPGLPTSFGDGLLCSAGPIVRIGIGFPASSVVTFPDASSAAQVHVLGGPIVAGDVRHYQGWYRDAASFCSASTFNLTQGITLTWEP